MVSPAVLAALPRPAARRGRRRAWRPVSRSPGRRQAVGIGRTILRCWLSSCACAAASERRSGAACDGRVDAKPALARDSSRLRLLAFQDSASSHGNTGVAARASCAGSRSPSAATSSCARSASRRPPRLRSRPDRPLVPSCGPPREPARRLRRFGGRFLRGGGNGLIRRRGAHALARRRTAMALSRYIGARLFLAAHVRKPRDCASSSRLPKARKP